MRKKKSWFWREGVESKESFKILEELTKGNRRDYFGIEKGGGCWMDSTWETGRANG